MSKATIVPAQVEHIAIIAAKVRDADRDELAALGRTPAEVMRAGLKISTATWTGMIDGVPLCMFGVAPVAFLLPESGRPWLVGSTDIDKYARLFLRHSREQLAASLALYPHLVNYVAAENRGAIAWLLWLGFNFDSKEIMINGTPFLRFELRRLA